MDSVQIITPWYSDKALWTIFLSPLFMILGKKFGIEFNVAEIASLAAANVSFIVGHKWAATSKAKAIIVAASQSPAANETPPPANAQAAADVVAGLK